MGRDELKVRLLRERPQVCDQCGEPLRMFASGPIDMHESLVSKGDVMGWKKDLRGLINHEYNCHLLHRGCHQNYNNTLLAAIQIVRYGKVVIQEWVDSLPFKEQPDWSWGMDDQMAMVLVRTEAPWILEEVS